MSVSIKLNYSQCGEVGRISVTETHCGEEAELNFYGSRGGGLDFKEELDGKIAKETIQTLEKAIASLHKTASICSDLLNMAR